jgi:hypothetical protein
MGIPKDQLLRDVDNFAQENGLTDIVALLRKGALIAQSPNTIDNISELSEDDCEVLRSEKTHRWRHPKILYFTIVMNSIAAAIRGWDQTGTYLGHRTEARIPIANVEVKGPMEQTYLSLTRSEFHSQELRALPQGPVLETHGS